ncbi:hypothetical protein [Nocardia sp. NPDC047654]|uniref:hypothetical protein n=1 Tax=Nocardia sp. NPDC047654 TaxID=3364314 RepID=UPI0037142FD9
MVAELLTGDLTVSGYRRTNADNIIQSTHWCAPRSGAHQPVTSNLDFSPGVRPGLIGFELVFGR